MTQLVALMDTLREHCPWDSVQTHASLMPHLVEESYEVLDALAGLAAADALDDAYAHLEEELGDLLFQIVFHARLADEAGQFDLADVARRVHDKLVHRHPHVFGDVDADSAEQVVTNWEAIKKSEKGRSSVTEGIPASLPALMLTTKLARKARAVGLEPDGANAEQAAQELAALSTAGGGDRPAGGRPVVRRQWGAPRGNWASCSSSWRTWPSGSVSMRNRRYATRALSLRADILAAEGVPEDQVGSR